MIALEFLPNERARVWRRSSLTMHPQGRPKMEQTAAALQLQEGWHAWRIVEESAR